MLNYINPIEIRNMDQLDCFSILSISPKYCCSPIYNFYNYESENDFYTISSLTSRIELATQLEYANHKASVLSIEVFISLEISLHGHIYSYESVKLACYLGWLNST